jgi:hypothetical protein
MPVTSGCAPAVGTTPAWEPVSAMQRPGSERGFAARSAPQTAPHASPGTVTVVSLFAWHGHICQASRFQWPEHSCTALGDLQWKPRAS